MTFVRPVGSFLGGAFVSAFVVAEIDQDQANLLGDVERFDEAGFGDGSADAGQDCSDGDQEVTEGQLGFPGEAAGTDDGSTDQKAWSRD
jgi:hypothetical protein